MCTYVVRSPPSQHYIMLDKLWFSDHTVELSLVNSAIQARLCKALVADKKKSAAAQAAVLNRIIGIANNAKGNLFLLSGKVESFVCWISI